MRNYLSGYGATCGILLSIGVLFSAPPRSEAQAKCKTTFECAQEAVEIAARTDAAIQSLRAQVEALQKKTPRIEFGVAQLTRDGNHTRINFAPKPPFSQPPQAFVALSGFYTGVRATMRADLVVKSTDVTGINLGDNIGDGDMTAVTVVWVAIGQ